MAKFKFDLKQEVIISCSGETGKIIGRAEYSDSKSGYMIRYKRADGVAVEKWWPETALKAVKPAERLPVRRAVTKKKAAVKKKMVVKTAAASAARASKAGETV